MAYNIVKKKTQIKQSQKWYKNINIVVNKERERAGAQHWYTQSQKCIEMLQGVVASECKKPAESFLMNLLTI